MGKSKKIKSFGVSYYTNFNQVEIDMNNHTNDIAAILLPTVPNWSGAQFWEFVQKKKSVVFFEFKNEYQEKSIETFK